VSLRVVATDDSDLGRRIQEWLTKAWAPRNKTWLRVWRTGPGLTIERLEVLVYEESFSTPPEVISCDRSELRFRLRGRGAKLWKDWIVMRMLPDLKTEFPEVDVSAKFLRVRDSVL
jgi:hypothetical protein